MDIRLMFPSLFLGAVDLHGKDKTLTIRGVINEELRATDGSTKKKPVMYFVETQAAADRAGQPDKEKRLVLNKTNAMVIAGLYGYEIDNWKGKKITLYPTPVTAFGKTADAIRIRPDIPKEN